MSLQQGWAKSFPNTGGFDPRSKKSLEKAQQEQKRQATIQRTQQQIAAALERRAQPKSQKIMSTNTDCISPTGIEAEVCADIATRQAKGIAKYGQTVAQNPLALRAWLQHAYEECLDKAIYLKRAMRELPEAPPQIPDSELPTVEDVQAIYKATS